MAPSIDDFKQAVIVAAQKEGWALPAGFDISEGSLILTCVKAGYALAAPSIVVESGADYVPYWDLPNATAPSHSAAAAEIIRALGLQGQCSDLANKLIRSVLAKEEERTSYWIAQFKKSAEYAVKLEKEGSINSVAAPAPAISLTDGGAGSQWVPVKSTKGPPVFGTLAIVFILERGEHQEVYNSIQVAERSLDPHSLADWFTHNGERIRSAISQPYGVTHWQPLPTAPTSNGN